MPHEFTSTCSIYFFRRNYHTLGGATLLDESYMYRLNLVHTPNSIRFKSKRVPFTTLKCYLHVCICPVFEQVHPLLFGTKGIGLTIFISKQNDL